jgi:hypothetical protein
MLYFYALQFQKQRPASRTPEAASFQPWNESHLNAAIHSRPNYAGAKKGVKGQDERQNTGALDTLSAHKALAITNHFFTSFSIAA